MLFYFVFHFLKNYNDVYVMYCLPVGCNNKKYKLQNISLAVFSDECGLKKKTNNEVLDRVSVNHSITGWPFAWANKSFTHLTIFLKIVLQESTSSFLTPLLCTTPTCNTH